MATAKFRLEGEDALAVVWNSAIAGAQRTAGKMQAIFGAAFAALPVAAVAQVVSRSIEMGDELSKAAVKAGVSGRAISELAFAAKLADVELGSLSNSLRFMQKAISEAGTGSKTAQIALAAVGVTLEQLKRLAPDKQFELLADRISKLKDPADRSRAATELFGRAGADLLPLFEQGAEGIRKARDEAVKFNQSFSDEQLAQLAKADDAIKEMKASFEGLATTLTAKVSPGLAAAFDLMNPAKIGRARIEAQITVIEQLLQNADGRLAGYLENILRKRLETLKKELARFGVIERPGEGTGDTGGAGGATGSGGSSPPGFAAADAAAEALTQLQKDREKIADQHVKLETETYDLINRAYEDSLQERGEFLGGFSQVFKQKMDEMSAYTRLTFDTWSVYADEAARNMQSAFADFLFDPFEGGVKGMLKSFIDVIRRMDAEMAAAAIFSPKSKGGLGLGDALGGFFGGLFGGSSGSFGTPGIGDMVGAGNFSGPRAMGGPVSAGRSYLVGERGPELFMPGQSGMILPNGAAPVVNINNHIDARGATVDAIKALPDVLRRNNEALKADILGGIRSRKYPI